MINLSQCACGQPIEIRTEGEPTMRADGKRIVVPHGDARSCLYRCPRCHAVVDESVPGAEHAEAATLWRDQYDSSLPEPLPGADNPEMLTPC